MHRLYLLTFEHDDMSPDFFGGGEEAVGVLWNGEGPGGL